MVKGKMCNVWCMMCDVWCMMWDVWCVMFDVIGEYQSRPSRVLAIFFDAVSGPLTELSGLVTVVSGLVTIVSDLVIAITHQNKSCHAMSKCKDLRCASTLNSYLFHLPSSIIHHPSSISHHPSSITHHTSHIIHHISYPSPYLVVFLCFTSMVKGFLILKMLL